MRGGADLHQGMSEPQEAALASRRMAFRTDGCGLYISIQALCSETVMRVGFSSEAAAQHTRSILFLAQRKAPGIEQIQA